MAIESVFDIGKARHRLSIQTRSSARSAQGGFTYSWNTLRTVWGCVQPNNGTETPCADAQLAIATHLITIRAQTETITPDMRLVWGTRIFNITSVNRVDEIQHVVLIGAKELEGVSTGSVGMSTQVKTYQTDVIDFTALQDVTIDIPSGFHFFPDDVEVICSVLGGNVTIQPTITVGIAGNLTKYLNRQPTQLTALQSRQTYSGLGANAGETQLRLGVSVIGAVDAGSYKGIILIKGVLV